MNTMDESYDRPCAFITGATSGIGAAFANRLAQKGFDLILHGRRQKELMERANNLERTYRTSVEIIIAELSRAEEVRKVEERIESLNRLDMLINNAGYWTPGTFCEHSPNSLEAMIMVHTVAPVRFIRAAPVLPILCPCRSPHSALIQDVAIVPCKCRRSNWTRLPRR
jgi:short-subunit dehydrogenase